MDMKNIFEPFLLALCCLLVTEAASPQTAPHVWLSEYEAHDHENENATVGHITSQEYTQFRYAAQFKTEIISKKGNVYKASPNVTQVVFSCQAEFPVIWKIPSNSPAEHHPTAIPILASTFTPQMEVPVTQFYRSNLVFSSVHSEMLSATCVSSSNPKLKSSFSFHADDEDGAGDASKAPQYNEPKNYNKLSLKGKASVKLATEHHGFAYFTELSCCTGINSQTPFLRTSGCSRESGCENKMLEAYKNFQAKHKKSPKAKGGDHSIGDDAKGKEGCTSKYIKVASPMLVYCKGKNVDVEQEYVVTFAEDKSTGTANKNFFALTPASEASKVGVQNKVLLRLGRPPYIHPDFHPLVLSKEATAHYSHYPEHGLYSSMLEERHDSHHDDLDDHHHNDHHDGHDDDHEDDKDDHHDDHDDDHHEDDHHDDHHFDIFDDLHDHFTDNGGIHLDEVPLGSKLVQGEPIHVMCYYLSYFYANGARLRLNWKNGTKTIIESDHSAASILVDHPTSSVMSLTLGKEIQLHPNMVSVDCFVPLLKTSGWEKRTFKFPEIRSPKPPKFSGPAEQVISVGLNATKAQFTCEVTQLPMLDFLILRDGMSIDKWPAVTVTTKTDRVEKDNILTKTVTFDFVNEEAFGEYRCVAESLGVGATKVVQLVRK